MVAPVVAPVGGVGVEVLVDMWLVEDIGSGVGRA